MDIHYVRVMCLDSEGWAVAVPVSTWTPPRPVRHFARPYLVVSLMNGPRHPSAAISTKNPPRHRAMATRITPSARVPGNVHISPSLSLMYLIVMVKYLSSDGKKNVEKC